MIGNTAHHLGTALFAFLMRVGEISLIMLVYFTVAWLIIKLVIRRIQHAPILSRYGKNGSLIAFRLISVGIYLIAAVGVLSYMNVNTNGILTLLSAITVAIGLALQDVARNLISGLFMVAEKPFAVGDRVRVRDREGVVQGIDIRTTMLRTDDGALLMVPNQLMFTEILQNNSRFNVKVLRYRISTNQGFDEVSAIVAQISADVPAIRPPVAIPVLIQHDTTTYQWEVTFATNSKRMMHDNEIDNALVLALPDATIARVT